MILRPVVRIAAAAAIVLLLREMLGPASPVTESPLYWDKAAHVIGFLVMALAIQVALVWRNRTGAAAAALIVGGLVELIQGQIGRQASFGDLIADAIGVGVAWLVAPLLGRLLDWLGR